MESFESRRLLEARSTGRCRRSVRVSEMSAASLSTIPPAARRRAGWTLAALVAVRAAIPLVVLAAHGHALPGLPRYVYNPRPGDAFGYYSAVRELLATWRQPVVVGGAFVVVAAAGLLALSLRRRNRSTLALLVLAYALGLVGALLALRMRAPGAPTI